MARSNFRALVLVLCAGALVAPAGAVAEDQPTGGAAMPSEPYVAGGGAVTPGEPDPTVIAPAPAPATAAPAAPAPAHPVAKAAQAPTATTPEVDRGDAEVQVPVPSDETDKAPVSAAPAAAGADLPVTGIEAGVFAGLGMLAALAGLALRRSARRTA